MSGVPTAASPTSRCCIFNIQERHWPTLGNGIESTIIPRTNNAVELVIRNRCPLDLVGYDIANLPMPHICRGWVLNWPPDAYQEVLPNA
jgi:hypothetical protein